MNPADGAGRGSADWAKVQPAIGELTQVRSYDLGAGRCCDDVIDDVIDDLHAAMRKESVPRPYVLVDHSMGGPYLRRFASRFFDEVAGLVLVDASDEKQLMGIIAPGTRNSRPILVPESGQFVHLDRPDVVIAAIREVVTAVRQRRKIAAF